MASVRLMPILDLRTAASLLAELRQARGRAIEIDASAVERVGGLCLQILLSARRQWTLDGLQWSVSNASPQYLEWMTLMGAEELIPGGTAR